jgi:hypothetical protein
MGAGKMISYCGIDCSKCETFLATRADSHEARKKIAEKCLIQFNVKLEPEQINCGGCKSDDAKCTFAETLCEIRKCNMERSNPHCALCSEYKCKKLKKAIESAPAIGVSLEALFMDHHLP